MKICLAYIFGKPNPCRADLPIPGRIKVAYKAIKNCESVVMSLYHEAKGLDEARATLDNMLAAHRDCEKGFWSACEGSIRKTTAALSDEDEDDEDEDEDEDDDEDEDEDE
jgi:hypothetical protein